MSLPSFPTTPTTITTPIVIKGDLGGPAALDAGNVKITSTQDGPALKLGDLSDPAPEYRLNLRLHNLNLTGPDRSTTTSSVGIAVNDTADVYVQDGLVSSYDYALKTTGGLISDFYGLTLRDSGFGFHLSETASFAPNSLGFFGLRAINNDRGGYSHANPNGIVNFFNSEIEGNNQLGTDSDGIKVTEHDDAGNINYFGSHFEANPGQYNLYYNGADTTKNLLMAGCQVVAGAARQVHVERGRATLIASRIATGGKLGTYFGANASGTLIDVEGDINGTLSGVICIRSGRLGFGINPTPSDPCINIQSASIVAASNIAANFRSDVVQLRFERANGTRVGYFQTSATGDHYLTNDNAAGGIALGGHGVTLLFVGRGGGNAIEPGADNTVTNGSGPLRWSTIYAASGTISTSDANAKEQIRDLDAAERAAAIRCKALVRAYKFRDAVADKGDDARWHFGVIAQEVRDAFAQEGLDAHAYGLFCHDTWADQPELLDDDDNVLRPFVPGGERYSLRYEELLTFMLAAL
ncbi:tail fiber domain-containing protein [Sphingomonas sp. OTU376]|uniref:tail fiber domain-containing protein n=1 Tax=Sphingomonas sp. OTU376 TaxID=3043863 RepID=UPI00313EF689